MYWRTGPGFLALWIGSLTLTMSAIAALAKAGSWGAALAFAVVAAVLAPPTQEAIARLRHVLAPARAAWLTSILLVPLGLAVLGIDWVARLEADARKRGFASAAQLGRAQDLGLATPRALADHDEAIRKQALAVLCQERRERQPLACYEAGHQKAALAFVESRLAGDGVGAVARAALAQGRKDWLAIDRECAGLLDRMVEDALPIMLQKRSDIIAMAAARWARHLSRTDLEKLVVRARPGVTYQSSPAEQDADQRLARSAPVVERELDGMLQVWATEIVMLEPGWRMLLKGRAPPPGCKPAQQAVSTAQRVLH